MALGFFSSLAKPSDFSIQLIEYANGALDVVKHDSDHPNGYKIHDIPLRWSNSLTMSLISDTFIVSSPSGSFTTSFPGFRLAYITAGSTQSDICYGGEFDIQVEVVKTSTSSTPPTKLSPTMSNYGSITKSIPLDYGVFASKIGYAIGGKPKSVVVVDLNGNSCHDLVAANDGSKTRSVLLN